MLPSTSSRVKQLPMYWIGSSDGLGPESTSSTDLEQASHCCKGLFEPQPYGWLCIGNSSQALQGA